MDIRQTPEYANYLKLLGWETAEIRPAERSPSEVPPVAGRRRIKVKQGAPSQTRQIFIKKFPLIGSIIKVQRIRPPIPFDEIEKIAKENRASQILIDQEINSSKVHSTKNIEEWEKYGYRINKAPYFPTKTIHIDLKRNENEIFNSFSEAKRRAVRKAEKNGITVKKVKDYQEFFWLKKRSLWEKPVIPIATGHEIINLFKAFFPKNAKILIAYHQNHPVAGIFLLFSNKAAYYWLAASTNLGKKLFAPTLLVWEALIIAKKLGCEVFDFEGVYDERYPVKNWLGFTKFKEGFGGKKIYYPSSLTKSGVSFFCII